MSTESVELPSLSEQKDNSSTLCYIKTKDKACGLNSIGLSYLYVKITSVFAQSEWGIKLHNRETETKQIWGRTLERTTGGW